MKIEYVDLYLIHEPFTHDIETCWKKLEKLRDQGGTVGLRTDDRTRKEHWSFKFPDYGS